MLTIFADLKANRASGPVRSVIAFEAGVLAASQLRSRPAIRSVYDGGRAVECHLRPLQIAAQDQQFAQEFAGHGILSDK